MPQDFWMPISAKLESAAGQLQQACKAFSPPPLPPQYVAIQHGGGGRRARRLPNSPAATMSAAATISRLTA